MLHYLLQKRILCIINESTKIFLITAEHSIWPNLQNRRYLWSGISSSQQRTTINWTFIDNKEITVNRDCPLGTWWCYIGNKVWIKETREHIWFGTSTFLRSAHAWNATWYTVNSLNMKPPRLWMYSAVGVLYNSSSVIPIITFSALSLVDSTDDHPLDCSTSSIIYSTERKIS